MVECYQPLTDSQWQVMEQLLPTHRKRRHCLRQMLAAMLYICRTGCHWRKLPTCFPPWPAVYYYFARWRANGTLARLSQASNRADRLSQGQLPTPSLALVDAQRVNLAPRLGQQRGLDAHKRVNGRKRQVLCDTDGRIWQVVVHAANGHDSRGAQPLLPARTQLRPAWASRLRSVLTDKAYQGRFAQQVQALGWQHQLARRPPSATRGFVPVAKRWVVERTFAWLNCFRRVVMDYERQPASHAAWLLIANLTMSLQRATNT
jgi:transposase